jgi:type IV pilus assembly protein PilA
MLHKLRARMQDEKGFTLIELLVVILIIGILAAIALPAFLNQREKAQDSAAKSAVRTAQTAMETYYTDTQSYTGADTNSNAALLKIEPALKNANVLTVAPTAGGDGYKVSVKSKGSNNVVYAIENDKGTVKRTCAPVDTGSCAATADAQGNLW